MTAVDRSLKDQPTARGGGRRAKRQGRDYQLERRRRYQNVGTTERAVSLVSGAILAGLGVRRRDTMGWVMAGLGGALIYRGASGNCPAYSALGVDTAFDETRPEDFARRGTHVVQAFLINKPASELYAFWRDFSNLPSIMPHLESVTVQNDSRSHWITRAPRLAGGRVEWDAEITRDEPNAAIAWRSLPGSDVPNMGSVEFSDAPADRGTLMRVVIDYRAPAGQLGRLYARVVGEGPERQIREGLRAFKRVMETGEVPTIDGQPRGTCAGGGTREQFQP
jgi:uncharacterized membrane protein